MVRRCLSPNIRPKHIPIPSMYGIWMSRDNQPRDQRLTSLMSNEARWGNTLDDVCAKVLPKALQHSRVRRQDTLKWWRYYIIMAVGTHNLDFQGFQPIFLRVSNLHFSYGWGVQKGLLPWHAINANLPMEKEWMLNVWFFSHYASYTYGKITRSCFL